MHSEESFEKKNSVAGDIKNSKIKAANSDFCYKEFKLLRKEHPKSEVDLLNSKQKSEDKKFVALHTNLHGQRKINIL